MICAMRACTWLSKPSRFSLRFRCRAGYTRLSKSVQVESFRSRCRYPTHKFRVTGKQTPINFARADGSRRSHAFEDCHARHFCDETHYPVSLFDLVLNLYAIPLTHAGFAPLRQVLHSSGSKPWRAQSDKATSPLKLFISYSHKDEEFKKELLTMLAGLQRQGIIDTWQDREIEAGDEWYKSIQDAMNDCDLALLLVSPDYLASRFIQEEEQPKLCNVARK